VQEQADRTGYPQAILGFANLEDPDFESLLMRHLRYPNLRGLRHRSHGDYFSNPTFQRNFALLDQHDLSCDFSGRPEDGLRALRDLASRFPATPVTLHHCGIVLNIPSTMDEAFYVAWKRDLVIAAQAENVHCVISGVPVFDHDWTIESMRPWVLGVIEVFGTKRAVFGSHFPYDTLFSSYERLIDAYREIVSDFTADEQADLLSRNALRLYRIEV
jgi:predicted TIM-barrel fold metal-dependent hydrolase